MDERSKEETLPLATSFSEDSAGTRVPVLVVFPRTMRPAEWRLAHARGEVPGSLPYDFERLERYGVETIWRGGRRSRFSLFLGRLSRRIIGWDMLHLLRHRSLMKRAHVVLTIYDEDALGYEVLRLLHLVPDCSLPHIAWFHWLTANVDGAWNPLFRLKKWVLRNTDLFVGLTAFQQRELVRGFDLDDAKCVHIPFGVEKDFFSPQLSSASRGSFVLVPGTDRFRDFDLVDQVAGLTREKVSYVVTTQRRPTELHLSATENVSVQRLSHCQLRERYAEALFVFVPVVEGCVTASGITTVCQSMLMGRTVVAAATPCLQELVQHGVNGLLFPPGDAAVATQMVLKLQQDTALRSELEQNALSYARDHLSTDESMRRWADLLTGKAVRARAARGQG